MAWRGVSSPHGTSAVTNLSFLPVERPRACSEWSTVLVTWVVREEAACRPTRKFATPHISLWLLQAANGLALPLRSSVVNVARRTADGSFVATSKEKPCQ